MAGRAKMRTAGKDHDLLIDLKRHFGTYKAAHTNLELHAKGLAQDEFYRVTRGVGKPDQVDLVRAAFDAYRARLEHAFDTDPMNDKRRLKLIGVHVRAQLRLHGIDPSRVEALLMAGPESEQGAIRDALWWVMGVDDPDALETDPPRVRACAH